jgi:hypothetical protein
MVERELNAVELDERVLLDLVRSTDRVGVLSIYIDAHSKTRSDRHWSGSARFWSG